MTYSSERDVSFFVCVCVFSEFLRCRFNAVRKGLRFLRASHYIFQFSIYFLSLEFGRVFFPSTKVQEAPNAGHELSFYPFLLVFFISLILCSRNLYCRRNLTSSINPHYRKLTSLVRRMVLGLEAFYCCHLFRGLFETRF